MSKDGPRLYAALLKHWRGLRGLSQLDLALAADVSARHISFLETGRAQPSSEMVLRLAAVLDVPLRDQNSMLRAADLPEHFLISDPCGGLSAAVEQAIHRMLTQHEPFPMVVLTRHYDVLRTNRAAGALLSQFVAEPAQVSSPVNLYQLVFHPQLARPFIRNWQHVATVLLGRLQREVLANPSDSGLARLLETLLQYPGVPLSWRQPDLSQPSDPVLALHLQRGEVELSFLATITVFSAPQNVTVEELRIESYFPLNDATAQACQRALLVAEPSA